MRLICKEDYEKRMQEVYCQPCEADKKDHYGVACRACWVDDAIASVETMPTVEPEWVPCSERLPKATGFYICTVNRELFDVRTMKFEMLAEGGYRWLLGNGSEVFPSFVLAWMPLPMPWKGTNDDLLKLRSI